MTRLLPLLMVCALAGCLVEQAAGPSSPELLRNVAEAEYGMIADGLDDIADRVDRGEITTTRDFHAAVESLVTEAMNARQRLGDSLQQAAGDGDVQAAARWARDTAKGYRR